MRRALYRMRRALQIGRTMQENFAESSPCYDTGHFNTQLRRNLCENRRFFAYIWLCL